MIYIWPPSHNKRGAGWENITQDQNVHLTLGRLLCNVLGVTMPSEGAVSPKVIGGSSASGPPESGHFTYLVARPGGLDPHVGVV